jgi:hypothetical protein
MNNARAARRTSRKLLVGAALATAAVAAAPIMVATAHPLSSGPSIDVIARGLNNPRGVAVGGRDTVYVAEAGLGAGSKLTGAVAGIGHTGSIMQINGARSHHPHHQRIVTGIASAAALEQGQLETLGIDGLGIAGSGGHQQLWGVLGTSGVPTTNLGFLVRVNHHSLVNVANVGGADYAWTGSHASDPWAPLTPPPTVVPQFPDANPYGVLVTGNRKYVVDAASNTVDIVTNGGVVSPVAYIPNPPVSDSVPTCITPGPDGALYVGTLNLVGFFAHGPGQSTVYRINPKALNPSKLTTVLSVAKPWATGFSTITGCTFKGGKFYAAEMFTNDIQVASFRHPTSRTFITGPAIVQPNGIAGGDGAIYVSTHSDSTKAGAGQVVRIRVGN